MRPTTRKWCIDRTEVVERHLKTRKIDKEAPIDYVHIFLVAYDGGRRLRLISTIPVFRGSAHIKNQKL